MIRFVVWSKRMGIIRIGCATLKGGRVMLYMVECGFADPTREDNWNEWYSGPKLAELLSMPGFIATQRYKALEPCPAPYLAVHSIESPSMFTNPNYKANGGGRFGDWEPSLMTNWSRRLFGPLREMPDVPADRLLAMTDSRGDGMPSDVIWLDGLGWDAVSEYRNALALDASVDKRGIAVVPKSAGSAPVAGVRLYAPLTEKRRA
jgi:hypothetical protein